MPRNRRTIARDSIFSSGERQTVRQGVEEVTPATRQTAMWLSDDELEWVDNRCRDIRKGGSRGASRSAFIRSLIQATQNIDLDLIGVSGEVELTEALTRSLAARRSGKQ